MVTMPENKNSAMGQLVKNEPNLISFLKEGDLIEAKLLARNSRAAYFDIEKFGTGIVYGSELINAKSIIKNLGIGDKISAKIVDLYHLY